MKNIIMGTAGHIDHGKTTLVKVLTGIDADRLPEEKCRGLTIDIGFAFFDLTDDIRVNFIDVPGHERFVKNMLAGATGIDAALMVVAADDGIMPQTREHLEILELLEIERLIVVITKCDMVEDDWLEMVRGEVRDLIDETRYKGARIMAVSSVSKSSVNKFAANGDENGDENKNGNNDGDNTRGIDELKAGMIDLISDISGTNLRPAFRLPIDRAFTIDGFGCVVTGSVIGGSVCINDSVELLPSRTEVRVRGVEVNGVAQNGAGSGQRAAINLAGIKSSDVRRGCELAATGALEPAIMVDGVLQLHTAAKRVVANRTRVRFHIFTSEIMARVILLDRDVLKPGDSALVQFRMERPVVAERNDRFIIRSYSPAITIGGGKVLRTNKRGLKRFKCETIKSLAMLADDNVNDLAELMLMESESCYSASKELQAALNLSEMAVKDVIGYLADNERLVAIGTPGHSDVKLVHCKRLAALQEKAVLILEAFHKEYPLRPGMEEGVLKAGIDNALPGDIFSFLLSRLTESGKVVIRAKKVSLCDFKIELTVDDSRLLQSITNAIRDGGVTPPHMDELIVKTDIGSGRLVPLVQYLVDIGDVVAVSSGMYYHRDVIGQLKKAISDHIAGNGPIAVSEFRDLTKTSRKYALPLLEYFDKIRFTKRMGDKRMLSHPAT